jgi:spore coat protein A
MKKNYPIKKVNLIPAVLAAIILILPLFVQGQTNTLNPASQEKWAIELPRPERLDFTKGEGEAKIGMYQKTQWLGIRDPNQPVGAGAPLMTTVWGYGRNARTATYPGPTIIAMRDRPLEIQWTNNLPTDNYYGHILPVDLSLHMAHPHDVPAADFYGNGNTPTVVHLHGGHTESASDGLPEAWFTQGFGTKGPFFVKQAYYYDNDQEAATLWYHDHALGITRLNVYAGLAGYYFLRDKHEESMTTSKGKGRELPHPDFEYEFVIQDRMFTQDGQLTLPFEPGVVGPLFDFSADEWSGWPNPTAAAEFFGDHNLVNGVIWPKLTVEKRKYRFRMLNGADSRFYILRFNNAAAKFIQIGSDNGFLNNALELSEIIIAPGERIDVVIDFSGFAAGDQIIIENYGPNSPYGGLAIDDPQYVFENPDDPWNQHTGQVVKFIVSDIMSNLPDASVAAGTVLNNLPAINYGQNFVADRSVVLFEGMDEKGRLQPLLGVYDPVTPANNLGSLAWFEDITENPALNATEIWEVINATPDAHPVHLHLVAFRILERMNISNIVTEEKVQAQHNSVPGSPETYGVGGRLLSYAPGTTTSINENEKGLKDTHIVLPMQKTLVQATFDRPGRYVWHCHILSHEDHEMMRPFHVGPIPGAGARVADGSINVDQNSPNPFASGTQIKFELKQAENVQLTVYDMAGRDILYQHIDFYQEGKHALFWDGVDKDGRYLPDGIYIYRVKGESFEDTKKLIIDR